MNIIFKTPQYLIVDLLHIANILGNVIFRIFVIAMNPIRGYNRLSLFLEWFSLSLLVLCSSVLLTRTTATSTSQAGTDVTPTEVNDKTHYKTGGGIVQPLRIATVEVDPFFSRELTPSGDSFSGYVVDVVREVSRIVPFQFEWVVVEKEETNGRRRKNGNSWTELTGKLANGIANVIVLPIDSSVNQIQSRRFIHTQPFLKSTLSLLTRPPDESTSDPHRSLLLANLLNTSNHSGLGFGVTNERVANQLKTSNLSLYQQIWNDRNPSDVVLALDEGLRKVRQGDFVLIMESTEAVYHSSREPCNLQVHDQLTHETGYVFATRRNASLVGLLNDALDRLRKGDFFVDLYRKWFETDECSSLGHGETGHDDHDLDMERIFFTSPIKFFKSKVMPQVTMESTRSTKLEQHLGDSDLNPDVPATVSGRQDTFEEFRHGHRNSMAESHTSRSTDGDSNWKGDRTTHPPLPVTSEVPSFDARVQTDPELNRRSQRRRSRGPKQTLTTVPLPSHGPPIHTPQRLDVKVQSPVPRTERTRESSGHSRWSEGRDTIQGSRIQKSGNTVATPVQSRTTKSSRDFVRDFDWVFVTEQPRSDDEFDYEVDDDDDDDLYHEQRKITVRVFETKQIKDPIRVSHSKDTGVKSDAKSNRKSSEKSSSSNVEYSLLLTLVVGSVGLQLISRRFTL